MVLIALFIYELWATEHAGGNREYRKDQMSKQEGKSEVIIFVCEQIGSVLDICTIEILLADLI